MFWFYDWTMILLLPGLILTIWAQSRISANYSKYSKVSASSGITAQEMVRRMLNDEGIYDVSLEVVDGTLTDHYDPNSKTIRLSSGVASSDSLAALGVAAHETGHVIQHRDGYAPLALRSAVVPITNIGSNLAWPLFLLGFIFSWEPLINAGIILFSLTVLFTLITLPVEFNASKRATAALESGGYVTTDENYGVKKVLNAAALTYVAAALTAILQLLRLLTLSSRRRR